MDNDSVFIPWDTDSERDYNIVPGSQQTGVFEERYNQLAACLKRLLVWELADQGEFVKTHRTIHLGFLH